VVVEWEGVLGTEEGNVDREAEVGTGTGMVTQALN